MAWGSLSHLAFCVRKKNIVSRPCDELNLQVDKDTSHCSPSVFAISSPVSFFGIVTKLWEAYLRLEDSDLWKALIAPEETSLVLKGMGWGENTPTQRQEAHRCRGIGKLYPQSRPSSLDQIFFFLFHTGVRLINNVVFILGIQQSDSVLYIYMYLLVFKFFSHLAYYRVLSRVPCAIQWVLVGYLF